jgi:hypothetical protein
MWVGMPDVAENSLVFADLAEGVGFGRLLILLIIFRRSVKR